MATFLLSLASVALCVIAIALVWLAVEVRLFRCGAVHPDTLPVLASRGAGKLGRKSPGEDEDEEGPDFLNYENLRA